MSGFFCLKEVVWEEFLSLFIECKWFFYFLLMIVSVIVCLILWIMLVLLVFIVCFKLVVMFSGCVLLLVNGSRICL